MIHDLAQLSAADWTVAGSLATAAGALYGLCTRAVLRIHAAQDSTNRKDH